LFVYINSIAEDQPGEKWKSVFDRTWPYYRNWFLSEGSRARPGYLSSLSALEEHMPEIMPIYHQLTKLAGGGDTESRFLSQFCPPPYMSGCSQIAWTRNSPVLIRNYDYSPVLFEGILFRTNWLRPVMGMSDCLWGLLDGMNDAGLTVSLTFGGRKVTGEGFGIPLIIRYILETCDTVDEAVKVLMRIPVHMAYNLTLVDPSAKVVTVYLAPDRSPYISNSPIGTNHQVAVEWEDYARITGTRERRDILEATLLDPFETEEGLIKKFLQPPLYNTKFEKAFGTLYTGVYHINESQVELHWPQKSIIQKLFGFKEGREAVNLKLQVGSKLAM